MGKPTAQRVREHFESRKHEGLTQIRVWVPQENQDQVRALAASLVVKKREENELRRRAELDRKQAAWEAKHPFKEKTRQQALEAMATDLGDSTDEMVESLGASLDLVLAQWAERKRIRIVG